MMESWIHVLEDELPWHPCHKHRNIYRRMELLLNSLEHLHGHPELVIRNIWNTSVPVPL